MTRTTRKTLALVAVLVVSSVLVPTVFAKSGSLAIQGYDVQSRAVQVAVVNTSDAPMSGQIVVEAVVGLERVRSAVTVKALGGERVVVSVGFSSTISGVSVVGVIDDASPI